ncbi:hypothetical protein SEA_WOFFORD_122 [Streptomyces phage Wofford]|uniref:Uncharacterized protein n=1 Tax=Streptomyces phage Wofford TaxID=2283267 RepID=A0A345M9X3_9CAUD|nr:hypothetical protein HWB78_gp161 [Streptomyces phage Wollford]AXH67294.1 hypothetical protein SEA_WOFFORD_122 [Streptomyces phage Wollford]
MAKTFEVNGTYKVGKDVRPFSNLYMADSASAAEKFAKKEFEKECHHYGVPRGTKLNVTNSRPISEAEIKRRK